MWDRLVEQVQVELEQLERLLATHGSLIDRCRSAAPEDVELSALGAMLHAFYTGVENLLKRVAIEVDGQAPSGDMWHRELLDQMTISTGERPAVLSPALRDTLRVYLDFRHVFRHAYTFDLRWEKMRGLVLDCPGTLGRLRGELRALLDALAGGVA